MDKIHDVLVVGAGPVGLLTGLLAARAGLDAVVIDQEWRIHTRSYACTLHPGTLALLEPLGLLPRLLDRGTKVETVAFYEGEERRAEVHLGALPGPFPFALILYQDDLEGLLEDALREQHGRKVAWGHRLEELVWGEETVRAGIAHLQHRTTGDPVQRHEAVVDRIQFWPTRCLVGADGPHSRLAHLLGTAHEEAGEPMTVAMYEFEPVQAIPQEMRVALDGDTAHVLWPLPDGTCRWTLESREPEGTRAAESAHETITVMDAPVGAGGLRGLERRLHEVAPWYTQGVRHVDWAVRLEFRRRHVRQFGRGRCWLVGDAAHQTAPGGAQSLNLGLQETAQLVEAMRRQLRENAPPGLLHDLAAGWTREWQRRLELPTTVAPGPNATPWSRRHVAQLVPCLPAGGADLDALMAQLDLHWR